MDGEKDRTQHKKPHFWEALITIAFLLAALAIGVGAFDTDPHAPMLLGVLGAALMALRFGFRWSEIEAAMLGGIARVLRPVVLLLLTGILTGVWMDAGVVPTMICYGLRLLNPSVFFVGCALLCALVSFVTGCAWSTAATLGAALVAVGAGFGAAPAMTAGAVVSGAYFGDKLSPLSDTTNLAPAAAGTDVASHIRAMLPPAGAAFGAALIVFGVLGALGASGKGELSAAAGLAAALDGSAGGIFTIHPLLLLPPLFVAAGLVLRLPAILSLALGALLGGVLGMVFQSGCTLGTLFQFSVDGYTFTDGQLLQLGGLGLPEGTLESVIGVIEAGGVLDMMFSASLLLLAGMFGGVMEETGLLAALSAPLARRVKRPAALVAAAEVTCAAANAAVAEPYTSAILSGRMYAEEYRRRALHPSVLSAAIEGSGAAVAALLPWNASALLLRDALGVGADAYAPYAFFNWLLPLTTLAFALFGVTLRRTEEPEEPEEGGKQV